MGLFDRLKSGLGKTRGGFTGKITSLLTGRKIDEDLFDELEEALIEADLGISTAMNLMDTLRDRVKEEKIKESERLKPILVEEIETILNEGQKPLQLEKGTLKVVLVTGVNGVGKTTTIGKMAARYKNDGYKVLLCAADTFRAAAAEQLSMWADRTGVDIVKHGEGADPGAVVFDGIQAAKSRKADVLLIDTAGRLQNKNNLMAELSKINKIIARELPDAPKESLLVLDASTGQNAISQAHSFGEIVDLTGIILTKIDGTAKGGIIVGIIDEMHLPVYFVGVGEQVDDLQDFDASSFALALFPEDAEEAE
ncbi:MAG: signal recognition particle-docking protein FtsY [Firmicutes bacterium]|nr:signal recognition particle-docking protein FtsY [Bacillota bacterium]